MAVKDRRRISDHYALQAKKNGYPARSVYKLAEFDQKYHLFKPGQHVLDLGCAPGSWTLYASETVGPKGRVIGVDMTPVSASGFPPHATIFEADLREQSPELVTQYAPFDIILSDMAPKTMGRKEVDQARSLNLCEIAWAWTKELLKPNGHFLFKIFQSHDGDFFINSLKPHFKQIIRLKPKATRSFSQEIFIFCASLKKLPA